MDIETGDVFTGRTLAAKMRDGKIDTVHMLVHPPTHNARGEKEGQAFMRVEVPHDTLASGGMSGGRKLKFEVTALHAIREIRITVKPRT